MSPFAYARASSLDQAGSALRDRAGACLIAGGTNILDLAIDGIEQPTLLVDINGIPGLAGIEGNARSIRVGALARMSDVAEHALVARDFPVVAQALLAGATPQLRHMASIGGNVLQRTRCSYFRDVANPACNKRALGTGCAALEGVNRGLAILGTSEHCIATHASDLAVALVAVDAAVVIHGGAERTRRVPVEDFFLEPGRTPNRETVLRRGELVTGVELPVSAFAARSLYRKVRDRASYQFAVASAAVAVDVVPDGTIRAVRVALGGVATRPWRAGAVEAALTGHRPTPELLRTAAARAADGAVPRGENAFKVPLVRRTVLAALSDLLEVPL